MDVSLLFHNTSFCLHLSLAFSLFDLVDGGYSDWGKWTGCNKNCGKGKRYRTRTCTNPRPVYGGKNCNALGKPLEWGECMKKECPGNELKSISTSLI